MWYDATSAAGSLEGKGSPVAGKIGYVQAPVVKTKTSGWLYAWSWAIEKASDNKSDAWKFVSWASSKAYEQLVGQKLGWASVPAGKRASTYSDPNYLKIAAAFAKPTLDAISTADPKSPGVQPRPTIGIQFVDIPEFTDFGTKVSQAISSAMAGKQSVDSALNTGQGLASAVGKTYG
jgi:sorbitol/mannitol transport system substrate-binding protein